MRTRLFVISLVMLMAIVPAEAKKKQINDIQNLSPAELEAKHDSIVYEGYRIYLKEMIAWTSEDMFFAKCSQQHMMQGSVISGIFPDFSNIFYNLDTRQCIYEVKTNVETNEELILFEYYNQQEFCYLLIVYRQKLIFVGLEEYLLYLEF